MKENLNKIILIIIIILSALFDSNAQSKNTQFVFKISVKDIIEKEPSAVNSWINYTTKSVDIPADYKILFTFDNAALGDLVRVNVFYSTNKGTILVGTNNKYGRLVYQLFNTRVRLKNGWNILVFDAADGLLWFTCTNTANLSSIKIGPSFGEGILTYHDYTQFCLANLTRTGTGVTLLKNYNPQDCQTPSSTKTLLESVIAETGTVSNVSIYPNPAKNNVIVKLATGLENATITIVSMLGTTIATNNSTGLQRVINLSGKPSGIYLVKITSKEGVVTTRKLVVE